MDIVIIGSGNTATVLGRKTLAAGHRIVQVYSRNSSHANTLATRLGTSSTSYISSIEKKADLMIIALRDDAVGSFVKNLGKVKATVVHTAGSLSIEEVRGASESYGVVYPLQSLRREIEIIPPLSLLVEGNDPKTIHLLKKFASGIAETVIETNDDSRLKYHVAATIVNNFTNYLFSLAESFCKKENISFTVLQPLIEETVMRLRNSSPRDAQTGPAIRQDQETITKHRKILDEYPTILSFYDKFTEDIQNSAKALSLLP
jgi:predicted short-subunit dehydrogenase-like oxidoreductase (DUF2520 family)